MRELWLNRTFKIVKLPQLSGIYQAVQNILQLGIVFSFIKYINLGDAAEYIEEDQC